MRKFIFLYIIILKNCVIQPDLNQLTIVLSGDPKNLDFKFCGEPVLSGKPYCLKHCELAYNNSKD